MALSASKWQSQGVLICSSSHLSRSRLSKLCFPYLPFSSPLPPTTPCAPQTRSFLPLAKTHLDEPIHCSEDLCWYRILTTTQKNLPFPFVSAAALEGLTKTWSEMELNGGEDKRNVKGVKGECKVEVKEKEEEEGKGKVRVVLNESRW